LTYKMSPKYDLSVIRYTGERILLSWVRSKKLHPITESDCAVFTYVIHKIADHSGCVV
jgi:hypothetical protein